MDKSKSSAAPPARRVSKARQRVAEPALKAAIEKPKKPKTPRVTPVKVAAQAELPKPLRDRFAMPAADFERLAMLKSRARQLGRSTKKNELLRAGLQCLALLTDEALLLALDQLAPVKARKS